MSAEIRRWATGAILALGAVSFGSGCNGSKGQLMLVFQTDMAVPKDIDAIRILATLEGAVAYDETFESSDPSRPIRLPATLGFLSPDDASQPLHVRVIASRGSDENVRMLREVVTTIPEGRTATLQLPIQFLCDGSGEAERDESGKVHRDASGAVLVKNTCGDGKTCVAGACVESEVESAALPEYEPAEVFGGGTGNGDGLCFDTVKCFEGSAEAAVDLEAFAADPTACRVAVSGSDLNVALWTQGGGICSAERCYVPLDAESDAGWKADGDGWIRLPPAVCKQVIAGQLLGVRTAPAGEGTCRKKLLDLPTCGPWSASGEDRYEPPALGPVTTLVFGQTHPIALSVTPSGLYWITGSTFDENSEARADGAVKTVPLSGGEPVILANAQHAPRDIAVDDANQLVFWTNAAGGSLLAARATAANSLEGAPEGAGPPPSIELFGGLKQPEGIALLGDKLYWTELGEGTVASTTVHASGTGVDVGPREPLSDAEGVSPYRVAAAKDVVCWLFQGDLGDDNGAVACSKDNATILIAEGQRTPRAIALEVGPAGNGIAVYWASFQGGSIFRFDLSSTGAVMPEEIATGQVLPSGIAVDAESIYWTNRGAGTEDGAVMRLAKSGGAPEVLSAAQRRPGAIAVDAAAVYWINEGSPDLDDGTPAKDGTLLRLAK